MIASTSKFKLRLHIQASYNLFEIEDETLGHIKKNTHTHSNIIKKLPEQLHMRLEQRDRKQQAPFIFIISHQQALPFVLRRPGSGVDRLPPPEIRLVKRQPHPRRDPEVGALHVVLAARNAVDMRQLQLQVVQRRPHVFIVHSRQRLVHFSGGEFQWIRRHLAARRHRRRVEDPVAEESRRERRPQPRPPVHRDLQLGFLVGRQPAGHADAAPDVAGDHLVGGVFVLAFLLEGGEVVAGQPECGVCCCRRLRFG